MLAPTMGTHDGSVVRSIIETPTGYTHTQLSAVESARRVLAGQHPAGFQSPVLGVRVGARHEHLRQPHHRPAPPRASGGNVLAAPVIAVPVLFVFAE